MSDSSRNRTADGAALTALFAAALCTNLGLALWTDVEPVVRWLVTIGVGIAAAAVVFGLVSRSGKR